MVLPPRLPVNQLGGSRSRQGAPPPAKVGQRGGGGGPGGGDVSGSNGGYDYDEDGGQIDGGGGGGVGGGGGQQEWPPRNLGTQPSRNPGAGPPPGPARGPVKSAAKRQVRQAEGEGGDPVLMRSFTGTNVMASGWAGGRGGPGQAGGGVPQQGFRSRSMQEHPSDEPEEAEAASTAGFKRANTLSAMDSQQHHQQQHGSGRDVPPQHLPMLPPPGAPQVVKCQWCFKKLAVPINLPPPKKGQQKLRCGKCLKVSRYSVYMPSQDEEEEEDVGVEEDLGEGMNNLSIHDRAPHSRNQSERAGPPSHHQYEGEEDGHGGQYGGRVGAREEEEGDEERDRSDEEDVGTPVGDGRDEEEGDGRQWRGGQYSGQNQYGQGQQGGYPPVRGPGPGRGYGGHPQQQQPQYGGPYGAGRGGPAGAGKLENHPARPPPLPLVNPNTASPTPSDAHDLDYPIRPHNVAGGGRGGGGGYGRGPPPLDVEEEEIDERKYFRKVVVNGVPITDRQVARAEILAGPIHPGNYWYDMLAGFWGVMGGPCLGIIPAGIEGISQGALSRGCSGGRTHVLVNGRELHRRDLDILMQRGLPEAPGAAYELDIDGNLADAASGQPLHSLGKLAPSLDVKRRGAGMYVPK